MPDRRVAQLTCSALFVDSFHHRAELDLAQLLPLERGQQVPPTTAPIIGWNDALNIGTSSSSSIPTWRREKPGKAKQGNRFNFPG